jgi:hypothetical protein
MDVRDVRLRLLVGIAPSYSLSDVDLIGHILASGPFIRDIEIELFDVAEIREAHEVEDYIPGLDSFYHTPLVGVWHNGVLLERAEGFAARKLILDLIGSNRLPNQ